MYEKEDGLVKMLHLIDKDISEAKKTAETVLCISECFYNPHQILKPFGMNFIITTSTIVCIVGILFGTYAYLKESSAFSALLITFMCVGVTTLIFALAMYDPQEQEQQQKQLSKVKLVILVNLSL